MENVDRNVVITFNDSLTSELINLSQKISEIVPSRIVLNRENQIPHLTLYMTKYPQKNIEAVIEKIAMIANETKPFNMVFNKKTCHSTGTIFIDPQISNSLFSLHTKLVDSLNPLREGLYNEDELNLPGRDEKAKSSLINFGMWAVKEDFIPHVSVGRVADPDNEGPIALSALPEKINFETFVDSISFVERGLNGTCKKILETFKLQR